MNLIQKWFGKTAPAAAVVVDRIAAVEAERDAAVAQQAAAKARLVDLATLTEEEHAAAETAQAEGRRAAQRAEAQIAHLRAAKAEAEAREEREAFDRDVAAHERETDELAARIEREYPGLAGALAALMQAEYDCVQRGAVLHQRGRKLGTYYQSRNPEAFRGASPQTWSVYYPGPDGLTKCDAESAPNGIIRWVNQEPVPAHDRVTVKARPREYPTSLLSAVKHLPGLRWGDTDFWCKPGEY